MSKWRINCPLDEVKPAFVRRSAIIVLSPIIFIAATLILSTEAVIDWYKDNW